MLALIPALPFAGFLINAALGRRMPRRVSGGVATGLMFGAFGVSLAVVAPIIGSPRAFAEQTVFTWFASDDLLVPFALRVDALAALMILVVTGIGALIHVYSMAYMHDETDSEYARYFSYLNLFAAFMLLLVLGASFPMMFIGWEGVGLCSYLLIGFWFQKPSAADAGKKAFVVNRVGDFGFILGMLLVFVTFGTLDFTAVAAKASEMPVEQTMGTLTIITLLLFLGATGKSAQIPLHVWLPDAMEGPTPVSALIHAATMVTAGVYMIGRNAALFSHAPLTLEVVAIVGVATALMAGTVGLVQTDIKRVLAYSTVSQLGLMFLAMGVGAFAAGIFHLYTHAFFKALLFLGAGAVIHALAGEQDLRNMGGLKRELPITYWTFLVGALAIAGVPLLSGFFSKDEILFRTFESGHRVLWFVAMATSFLTAVYMFRLVYLAFHGERRTAHEPGHPEPRHGHLHDAPASMAIPLVLLALGSIFAGYIGVPHALGGSNRIEEFLGLGWMGDRTLHLDSVHALEASERLELALMAVSTLAAFGGIALATWLFLKRRDRAAAVARAVPAVYRTLLNKYYIDEIYDAAIVQPIKRLSTTALWRGIDGGLIDGSVDGTGAIVRRASGVLRRLQTGSVRAYAASLILGVVVILGYYLWR